MLNPILQMLNGNQQNQNNISQRLIAAKSILSGKDPNAVFNSLMQTNPQFQKFVKENEGKTIEDMALEYDIDLNLLKQFM